MSRKYAPALALTLLACLAVAAPAGAAQVGYDGTVLRYDAAPGEINQVLVTVTPYSSICGPVATPCLSLDDSAHIAYPADRCYLYDSGPFGDRVECPIPSRIVANLGDNEDAWWDWDGPSRIDGGSGNDNPLYGYGGDDVINGGGGNDLLVGGTGDDALDGGTGEDALEGVRYEGPAATAGRDTYVGGGGSDSVNYYDRTDDLNLSPNGIADDGAPGEGDNIATDIYSISSGTGNDTLTGNDGPNGLSGGSGDDVVHGGRGDDSLDGEGGSDRVFGDEGQDAIAGGNGDDEVVGGPDLDSMFGEEPDTGCIPGQCDTGRDLIVSRDGIRELVDCGPGVDTVQGDAVDVLWNDSCELGELTGAGGPAPAAGGGAAGGGAGGAAGGGGAGGGGGTNAPGALGAPQLAVQGAKVDPRGRVQLKLAVPGAGALAIHATARPGHRSIDVGHAAQQVRDAGTVTVALKPSRKARKALRARRVLAVSVLARFTPAGGGKAVTQRQTVTLRAGKARS